MRHLGDITKIRGCAAPVVDVVIGGSPCQDLSIAGKRAGLAGARSGLYMEQIRIIKEMRYRDSLRGRTGELVRPRYMVWENVPGAFSSNGGKDFGAVLEEAIRVVEPEAPPVPVPPKGWPTSGCLMGDGWSVCWRVLDAQFWGVPQRRRRIALVADFGGNTAPEILFVRKGMSRDSEPGGTAREGLAGSPESGTAYAVRIRGGCDGGGKGALVQKEVSGTLGCNNDQTVFCLQGNGIDRADTAGCNGKGWKEDIPYTLNTIDRPAVMVFDTTQITSKQNGSIPDFEKPCHTLNANAHAPCAVLDMSHACDVIRDCGGIAPSLQARMGTGGNQVALTYQDKTGTLSPGAHAGSYNGQDAYNDMLVVSSEISPTLRAKGNDPYREDMAAYIASVDCRNGTENTDVNGTLQAKSNGGTSYNLQNVVREAMMVRRLTPLECERLQGFPDGWTDIGDWVDSKGKKRQTTDSARYKALGNSIALPPWKWVLKRLCAQYERDATMASLFDGIGGFPLIWEQLNGKGSCLWASEIEEFPMAVTRKRFD